MDGERRLGNVALHAFPSRPARPARAMTEAAKRIVSIWGEPREATPLGPVSSCPPFPNLSSLSFPPVFHTMDTTGRYVPHPDTEQARIHIQRGHLTLVIPCRSHCPPSETWFTVHAPIQQIAQQLINSVVEIPSPISQSPFPVDY